MVVRPVSPKNQLQGIVADDFVAKKSGHFLEDRVDKQNLAGIISDDNTVIQCFENGLHLLEPLRPFAVHESLFPNTYERNFRFGSLSPTSWRRHNIFRHRWPADCVGNSSSNASTIADTTSTKDVLSVETPFE